MLELLLVLGLSWLGGVWLLQRAVIFPAPQAPEPPSPPEDARQIWLSSPGARVEAWYLPPLGAPARPHPAIIFAHGNAELIEQWPEQFHEARVWGLAVLLVEYPGYGRSEGSASEPRIAASLAAAHDWLSARPEIDARRIIGYGRSLGGGAICALARWRPLAALILESTFTSLRPLAKRYAVPGALIRDPFDNAEVLADYPAPVFIFHGEADATVPVDHAISLSRRAGNAELMLLPCGHNDCIRPWPRIREFLEHQGLLAGH